MKQPATTIIALKGQAKRLLLQGRVIAYLTFLTHRYLSATTKRVRIYSYMTIQFHDRRMIEDLRTYIRSYQRVPSVTATIPKDLHGHVQAHRRNDGEGPT